VLSAIDLSRCRAQAVAAVTVSLFICVHPRPSAVSLLALRIDRQLKKKDEAQLTACGVRERIGARFADRILPS
jgi:hypothetical protein